MESVTISGTNLQASRVGLGTWAMGGWMWGGTDERESIRTIHAALDKGINLIDTAPAYGFGRSEEIVGKAVAASGHRDKVIIATKVGLEWHDGNVVRNATRARVLHEIEDVRGFLLADTVRRIFVNQLCASRRHWAKCKRRRA